MIKLTQTGKKIFGNCKLELGALGVFKVYADNTIIATGPLELKALFDLGLIEIESIYGI